MAGRKPTLALTGLYVLICQVLAQVEVNMEDRVEVLLNDMAVITCQYNLKANSSLQMIKWLVRSPGSNSNRVQLYYKDASEEIINNNTDYFRRILVRNTQRDTLGSSDLTISKVQVSDEKEFFCHVESDEDSKEGRTRLFVYSQPSQPSIEVEASVSVNSLKQVATCRINNAYPVPNITWYKDRTPLQPGSNVTVHHQVTTNPNGLVTLQSILLLKLEKKDKDALFNCEVNYFVPGAQRMMESDHVPIEIYYPTTELKINLDSPKGLVKEGDTLEFSCKGNGNPPPIITFLYNESLKEEISSDPDTLVLLNVTRLESGKYECLSLEGDVDTLDLTVHYLDHVVITPDEPIMLDEGMDLSLTCNALSSLSTQAVWYKGDMQVMEGNVFTLRNISYDKAGTYVCEVMASDLPALRKQNSVNVRVRGKPVITEGVTIIAMGKEKLVNLSCLATAHPTPTIDWELSDKQVPVGKWDTITDRGVLSTITIRATSDITASCQATNEAGTAVKSHNITADDLKSTTLTTTTTTTSVSTKAPGTPQNTPKRVKKEGSGVVIAVIIILILLLASLGSVLYFLYKKGKIPCGRSGKQDLTKERSSKDDIVVEMKSGKSEEAVLLQGVNGDKKTPNNQ